MTDQTVGSYVIVDGNIQNTPTFIQTSSVSLCLSVSNSAAFTERTIFFKTYNGTFAGSLVLDNIKFTSVNTGVLDSSGNAKLAGGTTT